MSLTSSMTDVGLCFCNDGALAAAVVYRVFGGPSGGGLQVHPLTLVEGHGYGTYDHPAGLTGADRVVCLNSVGGVSWAHLSSRAAGRGCLMRFETGEQALPKLTIHLNADPDAEGAFASAGVNPAEFTQQVVD